MLIKAHSFSNFKPNDITKYQKPMLPKPINVTKKDGSNSKNNWANKEQNWVAARKRLEKTEKKKVKYCHLPH